MERRAVTVLFLLFFVMQLAGCATGRRAKDLEMQGLKNQISVLESQLQGKDQEISDLKDTLARTEQDRAENVQATKKKVIAEVKARPKVKQIQVALKNAGFNPGRIDGRMGHQTREAIREFQKANNLQADGKVGSRTWALLKEYLYKTVK